MLYQFNMFYQFLNTPQNSFYLFVCFLMLAFAALVARVIACIGYQTQLALFRHNAKEIKSIGEITDTRSSFINRIVKDYKRTGEKGVSPRSARNIVEKHVDRLGFLGWSYDGMFAFAASFEQAMIFIGMILAFVFEDYRYAFAVGAVGAFVLMRLFATFFNCASEKARLTSEVAEYVEREIGQFYAGDSGTLILRLKNDLSAALLRQADTLSDGIKKMGADIAGVMQLSLQEMSRSIDKTMLRVSDFSGELSGPLDNWKKAVNEAASVQDKIGAGFASFEQTAKQLRDSAKTLNSGISGYSEAMRTQSLAIREEISGLTGLTEGLSRASEPLLTQGNGIAKQLSYIERNQEAVEHNMQRFELIMEDMTRKLGDGLGSMIDYHLQNSYSALNSALQDNIKQIVTANNELVERMQEMFVRIYEQSRSESQAVLKIKEQMDLHFESLKN